MRVEHTIFMPKSTPIAKQAEPSTMKALPRYEFLPPNHEVVLMTRPFEPWNVLTWALGGGCWAVGVSVSMGVSMGVSEGVSKGVGEPPNVVQGLNDTGRQGAR